MIHHSNCPNCGQPVATSDEVQPLCDECWVTMIVINLIHTAIMSNPINRSNPDERTLTE